jgi:DNA-binding MarR family transcriptional regulator
MAPRPAPAPEPHLRTASRPELLPDGTDVAFRKMIHALLSFANHTETVRDGFGALIGITGVQYEVLMSVQRLQGTAGISVGDVAAWMRRSGAFITIEAGKLVRDGLLEKAADPKDRRRVLLRLTRLGQARLATLAPDQARVNDVLFETLSAKDFAAFSRILEQLLPCGRRATDLIAFLQKDRVNRAA